ncbi:hypothetical protein ACIRPH_05225 [Nocardiopsis sp. NPDC101807]|uniref:hypothetical protein n=1 Tax=Nocardiopsis sp. NPDC101807 TaxID=3364339 RepID=UPI0037FFE4BB
MLSGLNCVPASPLLAVAGGDALRALWSVAVLVAEQEELIAMELRWEDSLRAAGHKVPDAMDGVR